MSDILKIKSQIVQIASHYQSIYDVVFISIYTTHDYNIDTNYYKALTCAWGLTNNNKDFLINKISPNINLLDEYPINLIIDKDYTQQEIMNKFDDVYLSLVDTDTYLKKQGIIK